MTASGPVRCAIYTRKSAEEGLQQTFNTLHAQREACEAYVRSQAGEGWAALHEQYDDGGYSGGEMDRPALRRLLADVAGRRVDVVVVYKVDRLTRSLRDFAKIIETFDAVGASFVSVTQAFNTTTSMGRLTLNVLLSFAQFEREVTCERIRDKIAASKAKGMWMGGSVPLGYDAPTSQISRALVVNEREAETVRLIFRRFLNLGSTLALQRWLESEGIRSKPRISVGRGQVGARPFSRGALRYLLKNRTYIGRIPHKEQSHEGRHAAIIDEQTFEAAQALLARGSQVKRGHIPRAASALLYRLLFDEDGQPMEPLLAGGRKGRRYAYYVSGPVWPGGDLGEEGDAIRRVPCEAVEELIVRRLSAIAGVAEVVLDRSEVGDLIKRVEIHSASVHMTLRLASLAARSQRHRISLDHIRRQLLPGELVTIEAEDSRLVRIILPIRLKVRGGRNWITAPPGASPLVIAAPNTQLIKRVRAGHAALRASRIDPDAPAAQIRNARPPRNARSVRWAFLAPDIQEAILEGRSLGVGEGCAPADGKIPLLWSEQRALFGMEVDARLGFTAAPDRRMGRLSGECGISVANGGGAASG